jgi:hypothetical protein
MDKKTISERINAKLKEPEGRVFTDGKWRFFFVFLGGLGVINAILTAMVFAGSIGGIAIAAGALVGWALVGTMYYSDSDDVRLARGVSLLDSVTLCFVIAHFCFLMWVYGHLLTLQNADSKYETAMEAFNTKAERIQADNVKIAAAAAQIAQETTKAERLRNDTAYQTRKAVEAGARIPAARQTSSGIAPSLSTAQIELERPKAPEESATVFLSRWDLWIRAANFGELILAAITLIYIRNRSAKFNAQSAPERLLPVATVSLKGASLKPALKANSAQKATAVATDPRQDSLDALRDHLRVIKESLPGRFFKADLIDGGVSIRLCKKVLGADKTIAKTRQSDKLLSAVDRPDFRERLIDELKRQGFPIGKGSE